MWPIIKLFFQCTCKNIWNIKKNFHRTGFPEIRGFIIMLYQVCSLIYLILGNRIPFLQSIKGTFRRYRERPTPLGITACKMWRIFPDFFSFVMVTVQNKSFWLVRNISAKLFWKLSYRSTNRLIDSWFFNAIGFSRDSGQLSYKKILLLYLGVIRK